MNYVHELLVQVVVVNRERVLVVGLPICWRVNFETRQLSRTATKHRVVIASLGHDDGHGDDDGDDDDTDESCNRLVMKSVRGPRMDNESFRMAFAN